MIKKDGQYDYIIVGSGIGGLSVATYLSNEGYSVLVLERHNKPGGYTHSFTRKGCLFDSAVRIVAGAKEQGLLSSLLKKMDIMDLEVVELNKVYKAVYPEHTIDVKAGVQGLIDAYTSVFPDEYNNIVALVNEMKEVYYCTISLLENNNPLNMLSDPLVEKYSDKSFQEFLQGFTENDHLIYSLQAMCGYFGASPENGSAMYFSYAIMSFFIEGAYYIKGSFQNLAKKLVVKIESNKGIIILNTEVIKIEIEENQVRGVLCKDGRFFESKNVISNGDYRRLIYELIGADKFPVRYLKRQGKMNPAMSVFEVFIITDLEIENYNLSHETFVYDDYNYSKIYDLHKKLENEEKDIQGIAIACPTLADKKLAPENHHTIILSTILPYHAHDDWSSVKDKYARKLIQIAEKVIPELSKNIVYMEAASPKTMERYTLNSFGSSYGWEQNQGQAQYRPKQKTPIQGLYLVGQWTEPGGGIVSVALSGFKLANKLINEESISK